MCDKNQCTETKEYESQIMQLLLREEDSPKNQILYRNFLIPHDQKVSLLQEGSNNSVNTDFLRFRVSDRERAELIDWLVKIHNSIMGLKYETLYITVNLVDRVLQLKIIPDSDLYLLGITCLLLASKFEDIIPPTSEMLCGLA